MRTLRICQLAYRCLDLSANSRAWNPGLQIAPDHVRRAANLLYTVSLGNILNEGELISLALGHLESANSDGLPYTTKVTLTKLQLDCRLYRSQEIS